MRAWNLHFSWQAELAEQSEVIWLGWMVELAGPLQLGRFKCAFKNSFRQ